jgi:predicted ABC-type ATPase
MIASNLNEKEEVVWDDIKDKITDQGVAVFMMGIPGSGKSTTVNIALENMGLSKDEFIDIDPDNFMAILDGYNNKKASVYNLSGVMMASKIMNRINKSGNKYKYIYYGTGKNFQNYITLINKAKKNGHRTVLVNVKIDVSTAIERASKRSRAVNTKTITNINNRLKQKHTRTITGQKKKKEY